MRLCPHFQRLAVAALQAALAPKGSAFVTKNQVRSQLRDAVEAALVANFAHWPQAQRDMLQAAKCTAYDGRPLPLDVVQAALALPWPAWMAATPPAWMARADIGGME